MRRLNILVTGVGAIIGYGIIKSLKLSKYDVKVIGVDIYEDAVGQHWCDKFYQGELASSDKFLPFIYTLVEKEKIDLIIPGIEQDIDAFLAPSFNFKIPIVLNSLKAYEVCNDKYNTFLLLQKLSLLSIKSFRGGNVCIKDIEQLGDKFVMKPCVSYAGKGVQIHSDTKDVIKYIKNKSFIFQEYINSGKEVTISVFGLKTGAFCNPIAFERELGPDGATHKAKVIDVNVFLESIEKICSYVKPVGPTNFQYIYHEKYQKYVLLEINPRISSSTSIRTAFGINEAEMCLEYYILSKKPCIIKPKRGRAQRFIDEVVTYDCDNL